jgi:hypothetical protein
MQKVSFFFLQRGDRTGGWTFNLWNTVDDKTSLEPKIKSMAEKLQNATGGGCNVVKARYSKDGDFRVADEVKFAYDAGLATDEPVNADYQTTAVGLRFLGNPNYKVTQWLSGIADKYIINAGRLADSFKSSVAFKGVQKETTTAANGWTLRVLDKTRPKKTVSAISDLGIVTCTGHGFDGTKLIRISRVKGNKYPNQIWTIEVQDPNTFKLVGFADPSPGGYMLKTAIARPQLFTPVAITDLIPFRATSHKRGRPIDLLTGKGKKKV